MDPDTRRLMIFAGGLGAVLAVLIGASALMGRHSGEVPVISADPRPIREKPINPGGMKIDGAENDVFSGGSDTSNAKLAPAPESPNTKALRAEGAAPAGPSGASVAASNEIQGAPAGVTAGAKPAPAPAAPAGAARTAAAPAAPAGVARTAVVPAAPAKSAPAASAAVTSAPVTSGPVTSGPGIGAKPAVVASAVPKAAPAPTPAKPAVAEEAHPQAAGHAPMVQLAALGSEEAARAEWASLVKKMPELLSGKQPNYSRTERDGHAFWRVRTSGFADVAQARGFCERVRSKGAGCSVADF